MLNVIKEVVNMLNVAELEKLKGEGFDNECFFNSEGLTNGYKWVVLEKKKYFYINCGSSGVFMVDREGEIFNIKGYGTADKNKKIKADLGNISDYGDIEKVKILHSKRYNYLR